MRYLVVFASFWLLVLAVSLMLVRGLPSQSITFVPTYSAAHARYLGLEPLATFRSLLDDFQPTQVRLQADWNIIEPSPGRFDFSELDELVRRAGEHGVGVTLAVGRKLPRWPECHDPAWLTQLAPWEVSVRISAMLRAVVSHYRSQPAITRWQLENEPLFAFGECPPPNWHQLVRERDLLRSLDPSRPILMTDSGELSAWWETSRLADEQGATLYRVTWNSATGYFTYPLPAVYYRLKAALVAGLVRRTVVSELQLEPWAPHGLKDLPANKVRRSLSLERFRANVDYARRTGLPEAFLWGVEWWYYAAGTLGDSSYLGLARELFAPAQASTAP